MITKTLKQTSDVPGSKSTKLSEFRRFADGTPTVGRRGLNIWPVPWEQDWNRLPLSVEKPDAVCSPFVHIRPRWRLPRGGATWRRFAPRWRETAKKIARGGARNTTSGVFRLVARCAGKPLCFLPGDSRKRASEASAEPGKKHGRLPGTGKPCDATSAWWTRSSPRPTRSA